MKALKPGFGIFVFGAIAALSLSSCDRALQRTAPSSEATPAKPSVPLPSPHWQGEEGEALEPLQPIDGQQAGGCCQPDLGFDKGLGSDRPVLLQSLDRSLGYLRSQKAVAAYRDFPVKGVTRERVERSLRRFRALLVAAQSPAQLQAAVKREFVFYQAIGREGRGNVLFSAYFEPIYSASRVKTAEYRYPIYRQPANLKAWPRPHPTRKELEGEDGLQTHPKLQGLELFWLRDRWQAYLIHIQGSAKLQLTDGSQTTVGYAGNTAHNYTSIGWELAQDGKLELEAITMPKILNYFEQHPEQFNDYLTRDRSFVFFAENHGDPASGSIGVPLSPERSIATDKSLMPPGALALIHTTLPFIATAGDIVERPVSRYVLDQDAGGAIKGAGRVDYFLGTGTGPEVRAGVMRSHGQLYYLLLKEEATGLIDPS